MLVQIEKQKGIWTITINRPDVRNAICPQTAEALHSAFLAFDQDKDSTVAILTGAGEHFCAGADLNTVANGKFQSTLNEKNSGPLGPTHLSLSKPVIASISGYAVAGGLELALWCDLRIIDESAILGVFCRRFGVPLIDGGTIRLPRLIGLSRAMDLILTGRAVESLEAYNIGLANRLVPTGQALIAAKKLAKQLQAFPQNCLRSDRKSAYEQHNLDLSAALANEFNHGLATIASLESQQGAKQFTQGMGHHGQFNETKSS